jgi:hypothetical protein
MNFDHCKLNYFTGEVKLHKKEVFYLQFFINQPLFFKQKPIGISVKNIFHSFESQHFRNNCWLFFEH